MKRAIWQALLFLGRLFCELAYRTDCRGPFAWFYRLGCWFYGLEVDYGKRHGFLVKNPRFGEPDQPKLIEAPR